MHLIAFRRSTLPLIFLLRETYIKTTSKTSSLNLQKAHDQLILSVLTPSLVDFSMADEDFEEEEVWASVKERKDGSPSGSRRAKDHSFISSSSSSSSSSGSKRLPSATRLIPRANANGEGNGSRNSRQSAPVNIPDWSKIYRSNASVEENANADGDGDGCDDDDDDDDDDDQVPPHEWIAKKLARSQISSFSVCEGAGRTLKGRDQRKVRNAVLTKTGFLE